ncbi:MAG TPA: glycoside hydrolase family 32 protein [Acidobacteriaceae bacterium]|jgi:beta-fructofuranosidase
MPTRRTILTGLALTTGAAFTHKLRALAMDMQSLTDAEIARDPMRPQYHLLPAHGWMNDPCGPLYWKGRYHMFYQYNSEPVSAVKLWAHATSPDMIHWHREPVALAPTPGGPDAEGCWTGTAAIVDGKPTFLYTGVSKCTPEQATLADSNPPLRESVCMAIAEDDTLLRWRKLPHPVIAAPPAGMKVTGFRDPSPWRNGGPGQGNEDHWSLIVASGERGVGGSERGRGGEVLLYRSTDFRYWEYLHPLAQGKPLGTSNDVVASGEMWECPDFFPLNGKHVLIHSTEGKTLWQIGTLDTAAMLFHAEKEGLLDHGAYYAPKSQLDAQSNRILWGWITDTRPQAEYAAAGWSGMMSLPRRLSIEANGDLVMDPVPEIASLQTEYRIGPEACRLLTPAQQIGFDLRPSDGPALEQSFVDSQGPVILLRADPHQPIATARVGDKEISGLSGKLGFLIFLDHSVAEIFLNRRHAITQRYYQRTTMEPAVTITLGGSWRITQQQAWSLKSIW